MPVLFSVVLSAGGLLQYSGESATYAFSFFLVCGKPSNYIFINDMFLINDIQKGS